jgi:hypothetical protein
VSSCLTFFFFLLTDSFISTVPNFAAKLKAARKGIVFVGDTFLFGLLGDTTTFDVKALDAFLYV